jgi:hypothetical protein
LKKTKLNVSKYQESPLMGQSMIKKFGTRSFSTSKYRKGDDHPILPLLGHSNAQKINMHRDDEGKSNQYCLFLVPIFVLLSTTLHLFRRDANISCLDDSIIMFAFQNLIFLTNFQTHVFPNHIRQLKSFRTTTIYLVNLLL